MKKVLLYAVFMLVQHVVFAQYQLDSVISTVKDKKYVAIQKRDVENRELEIVRYEIEGDSGKAYYTDRIFVQYDEHDNELFHIQCLWNEELTTWLEREKIEKTYDDSNRMVSYGEYELRNGTWRGLVKMEQEFDSLSITTVEYSGEGAHWNPRYKNIRQFNDNRDEVLAINYQWDSVSGDWKYWMKHENTFIKDTLLEESATYRWEDDQWINHEKTVYKYRTDIGKVSDRVVYVGTNDGWRFKYLTQMKYYDAARREEAFYWMMEEEQWRAETFKESYIDKLGRETDFVLFLWNLEAEEYRRHVQGMTVYNENDKITLSQEVRYEDGQVNYGLEWLYDFDEDGNMIRETQRSFVPEEGWVPLQTREFTYHKEMLLQGRQAERQVFDYGNIGYDNISGNKHAIDRICFYRYLDGQKLLQEESTYYYNPIK